MNIFAWFKANPLGAAILAALGITVAVKAKDANAAESDDDQDLIMDDASGAPGKQPKHRRGFAAVRVEAQRFGKAAGWNVESRKWFERFAVLQAASESGANNYRGLGIEDRYPSWAIPTKNASVNLKVAEANAAKIAYDRNVTKGALPSSDAPMKYWLLGSGGWFGILPANGLVSFGKADANEYSPVDIFDARRSVAMLADYMRRLTWWKSFKAADPSNHVEVLKAGMASPSLMGKPDHSRFKSTAKKARKNAALHGVPKSFFSEPIPSQLRTRKDMLKINRKMEGRS